MRVISKLFIFIALFISTFSFSTSQDDTPTLIFPQRVDLEVGETVEIEIGIDCPERDCASVVAEFQYASQIVSIDALDAGAFFGEDAEAEITPFRNDERIVEVIVARSDEAERSAVGGVAFTFTVTGINTGESQLILREGYINTASSQIFEVSIPPIAINVADVPTPTRTPSPTPTRTPTSTETPDSTATATPIPLPSTVFIQFDEAFSGTGWDLAEQSVDGRSYRWSIQDEATVDFPALIPYEYELSALVIAALKPEIAETFNLLVNGANLPVITRQQNALDFHYLFRGRIPANLVSGGNAQVSINVDELVRPSTIDTQSEDTRTLGVAVDWVQLRPIFYENEFDQPIVTGSGWSGPENNSNTTFQWTNSQTATLEFELLEATDLDIEFFSLGGITPEVLETLELRINGVPIDLSQRNLDGQKRLFWGRIPASAVQVQNVLEFSVDEVVSIRSINSESNDPRSLGVALDSLTLYGAGGQDVNAVRNIVKTQMRAMGQNINARSAPTQSSNIEFFVSSGQTVYVVGRSLPDTSRFTWYQIEQNGQLGWVREDLINLSDAAGRLLDVTSD